MPDALFRCCALAWLLVVSAAGAAKVEVVALRDTRHDLCHAIIEEMHTEIHKHSLKKDGEDDIFETVPAICLAIVQNYTLTKRPARWKLVKRKVKLDDDETPDPATFEHLRLLKQLCEMFTDEQQLELSELMCVCRNPPLPHNSSE